jgi:hypothetical protein
MTMASGLMFPQLAAALPATGIDVNEAMSDNGGSLLDVDGDASDWIELANTTGSPIDLGSAYLTDDPTDLTQWQFPSGVSIPANGYLVVFASDKNRAVAGQQLHTNFKLSSGGEDVLLVDDDGTTVVSTLTIPALDEDRSFGLAGGNPAPLQSPTPNAANSGPATSSVDVTPSGTFQGSQTVTLSQRGDGVSGTIRYTTNGSEPTASSPAYSGPLNLNSSGIVRAKVFASGVAGAEGYGTYTEVDGSVASSDLPLVIVDTRSNTIPLTVPTEASMTVIDTVNGVASPTGPADYSGPAGIEIRGSSSAGFPKKQYKTELHDAAGNDVDADLLGLGSEEDWILYAPGRFDRNMISNPFAQTLAGQLGLTEMSSRFVEVYIADDGGPVNSADYDGVYLLLESIKIDKERVDITKLSEGSTDITGGYVISLDRFDDNEHNFQSQAQPSRYFTGGVGVNVVRPKLDKLTTAQQNYIEDYVGDFETALYGANFANPATGYRAYIDVPSWIDVHIIRYLSKDPDIGRLSEHFYKDQGGKLVAGPAWDFDRTFNSDDWRDDNPREPWYGTDGIDPLNDGWWGRLFEDPAFRAEYASRWAQLRAGTMSDASINGVIDNLAGQLSTAYGREDARWGSTGGYGSRYGNYAGEITALKNWLAERTAFMDETIAEYPALNMAEGKATSQSSVNFGGQPARGVDGDTNGRYNGDTRLPTPVESVTHTNFETQPWWQVDLGSVQNIDSIRLWNRSDCCEDRLSNFHVFVSDVPFTSNTVAGTQAQAGVTDIFFSGQARRTESFDVGRSGRYVRVQLDGSGILSLAEVQVFENVTPPQPPAPGLILNEWNAVSSANTIANGDTFFGSVAGNGGDWFELVVVEDNLDVRGWELRIADSDAGTPEVTDTFVFNNDPLLSNLRAGTIITVSEDLADDVSFSPAQGDWWINLQAESGDAGGYFTSGSQSNFDTNNSDWQLTIADDSGTVRFGPAGEGAAGLSGVGSSEVGELEADPSDAITAASGYDDGDASTFGSPNEFGGALQDFSTLRSWYVPQPMAPTTTVTFPANDEFVDGATDVVITGSVTDDVSVARTRVALIDISTGLFRQADGSFGSTRYFADAELASPGAATTDWTFTAGLADGRYRLIVRSVDDEGLSETAIRSRFVVESGVTDTAAPMTTLDEPAGPDGAGVTVLSGSTVDNVDVAQVQVALVEIASGEFLQADGSFGTTRYFADANLASPGAASTAWTLPVTVADGRYRIVAKATDASGNRELSVRLSFDVISTALDTEAPTSSSPTGRDHPTGTVTYVGTASDNVGVETVRLWVRSRDDVSLWLQPDGSLGTTRHTFFATLDNQGDPVTDWSIDLTNNTAGRYRLIFQALDTSNNIQSPSVSINLILS